MIRIHGYAVHCAEHYPPGGVSVERRHGETAFHAHPDTSLTLIARLTRRWRDRARQRDQRARAAWYGGDA